MQRIAIHIDHSSSLAKITTFFLLFFTLGCSNASSDRDIEVELSPYQKGCLEDLNLSSLEENLESCNKEIITDETTPQALNDRSIIYMLKGETSLACQDVSRALEIIDDQKVFQDYLIHHELKIRQSNCKQRLAITDKD